MRISLALVFCLATAAFGAVAWAEEAEEPAEEAAAEEESSAAEETSESIEETDTSASAPSKVAPRVSSSRGSTKAEIEGRIQQLQKAVSTSKSRLAELADRVLQGGVSRSKIILVHRNEMGSSFKLVRAHYALDGAPILSRVDETGELAAQEEIELFNGYIVAGQHSIAASLEYRGHGYGIFSYLKGYRFKVRSTHTFQAEEGKQLQLRVTAYEKGDQSTPLEERPDVRYVERFE